MGSGGSAAVGMMDSFLPPLNFYLSMYLNFCVIWFIICTESKGIWVRAFEKPNSCGAFCIVIRCNIGAIAPLFLPHHSGRGAAGYILKTSGVCNCWLFEHPDRHFPMAVVFLWRYFMSSNNVDIADVAVVGLGIVHWLINILFPIAIIIIMLKSCS